MLKITMVPGMLLAFLLEAVAGVLWVEKGLGRGRRKSVD